MPTTQTMSSDTIKKLRAAGHLNTIGMYRAKVRAARLLRASNARMHRAMETGGEWVTERACVGYYPGTGVAIWIDAKVFRRSEPLNLSESNKLSERMRKAASTLARYERAYWFRP